MKTVGPQPKIQDYNRLVENCATAHVPLNGRLARALDVCREQGAWRRGMTILQV